MDDWYSRDGFSIKVINAVSHYLVYANFQIILASYNLVKCGR